MQVKRVEERLLARGILLEVDDSALDFLADRGYDPAFGATPAQPLRPSVLEATALSSAGLLLWAPTIHQLPCCWCIVCSCGTLYVSGIFACRCPSRQTDDSEGAGVCSRQGASFLPAVFRIPASLSAGSTSWLQQQSAGNSSRHPLSKSSAGPAATTVCPQEMLRGSFVEGDTVAVTISSGPDGRPAKLAFSRAAAGDGPPPAPVRDAEIIDAHSEVSGGEAGAAAAAGSAPAAASAA